MDPYLSIRRDIVACCRWLNRHGYFGSLLSAGGNVSVRIPGESAMAITPSAVPYRTLRPVDICVVDFDLKPVAGERPPSIETPMHAAIYGCRSDVGAVVHTHQAYASIFALIGRPLPALFDEVVLAIGERVDVVPYAFSGTAALADHVRRTVVNGCHCFILQNHGALSLGKDLDQAWKNAELLEKSAQAYYRALATGLPVTCLPAATVRTIADRRRSSP